MTMWKFREPSALCRDPTAETAVEVSIGLGQLACYVSSRSPPLPEFSASTVARLLADARRHCCVCLRWCGQRIQIHHIDPKAAGGSGDYENGIPVCLDCHAEIESTSNMGRRFSAQELREHRDRWFSIVRESPEVLLRSAQSQSETGPLEALLAELEFNWIAVSGGPVDEGFPVLSAEQFRRCIATNALAALPQSVRESVHRCYGLIVQVNYHFEEMAHMDRGGGSGGAWANAKNQRTKLRGLLVELVPRVRANLEHSLGRNEPDLLPRSGVSNPGGG